MVDSTKVENNNDKKKRMEKLTIFSKRVVDFTGKDGVAVKGNMYGAFNENNEVLEFFSRAEHKTVKSLKYSAEKSEEVDLTVSIFGGKLKFREAAPDSNLGEGDSN